MKKAIKIVFPLLLLVGLVSYFITAEREKQEAQEIYQQVQQNLLMISKQYNKGVQKMYYLKEFEETKHKIVKEPK